MSTCITVDGLKKSYAGRTVVDHLSFAVQQGEVFGLLGHNGAGKSTTIELLLGLKKPEQGKATILGMKPEANRKKLFERVGVQFQASNYQCNIRVDEACQERALLYAHPADYRELLKQFGIEHLEKSPVNSIPLVIVDYRDKKILKHFYASPCSPALLLGADVLCSFVTAALSALSITVTAVLVFGYRMQGNVFCFIGAWLLTLVSMFSIGLLMASLCKTVKSVNAVTSLVYFPMLFLSGATIPFELFPKSVQAVANVLPLTQGIRLMKAASMGTEFKGFGWIIALLLGITVICSGIAVKTFRWEGKE